MKLKYLALCLAAVSCTQSFGLLRETTEIFENPDKVIEYLTKHSITGGVFAGVKSDATRINYVVIYNCDPSSEYYSVNPELHSTDADKCINLQNIFRPASTLPEWMTLTESAEYQVVRIFEPATETSSEKNIWFKIKNKHFKTPGIATTEWGYSMNQYIHE